MSCSGDFTLKIWNIFTKKSVKCFTNKNCVTTFCFLNDNKHAVIASGKCYYQNPINDYSIRAIHLFNATHLFTFTGH